MNTIRIEFYRSGKKRDWRWRIKVANGKIVGQSSEGYRRSSAMLHNLFTVTGVRVMHEPKDWLPQLKVEGTHGISGNPEGVFIQFDR